MKSRGEMRVMSCEPSWQADLGVRPVGFVGLPILFAYYRLADDWFRGIAYLPTLSGISFSRIHKTLRPTDLVSLKIPYDSGFVFFQPRSVNE